MRKTAYIAQYERPVAPANWGFEARRFVDRLNAVLDDVYRRYGRLRPEDLSAKARTQLSGGLAGDVSTLAGLFALVAGRLEELSRGALPVGSLIRFAGDEPGEGWAFAQGQALDAAAYPEAAALFGDSLPGLPEPAPGIRYIVKLL
ncbi:MAG: tail fiber protein [Oscillospiraceae bacterium]|jgi:hypothetical protein|nr:tail fiber protein [Oscillospiraceae bacterium]